MSLYRNLLGAVALGAVMMSFGGAGHAQTNKQVQALEQQIDQLRQQSQAQIQALQAQVNLLKEQAETRQQAAAKPVPAPGPKVTETRNHHFGLSSADGRNTIELTGRLHVDVGDYFNYTPNAGTVDRSLAPGINVRRARIGVTGVWEEDFRYSLIYDFGGTSDSLNPNNFLASGNSGTSPTTSNTALSGVENAFITYNGFYSHGQAFPVAFDFGIMDVPWTLDEATSSNDIMFMERSSSQVVATTFGGGDFRSAFGVRSNNDSYWIGAYLTGPTSGALHTDGASCVTPAPVPGTPCTAAPNGHGPQTSLLARAAYTFHVDPELDLHVGANFGDLIRPRGASNAQTITLADRPELRVDPSQILGTPAIAATGGFVEGGEAALAWQNLFVQGEYFHYTINQMPAAGKPTPDLNFNGGYAEVSYSIGGRRHYSPAQGAWTGVYPDQPFSWSGGGWGAVEFAARYSTVDLNTGAPTVACPTCGARGGLQTTYGIGINYYPSLNMRFMLDYEHGSVAKAGIGPALATGAKFDWIAARTQIMF